ncbi:MAG: lactate utilization protein B/C [Flavobacteriaceae bacterium]|nr:lactate utilization protein B/C [Flavobacteriaceae bacterium]
MNFFSKFFKKSSSEKEPKSTESKFLPKKKAVIEERFILKFIENGGKFLYCENLSEVQENFDLILAENEWINQDLLMIKPELKKEFNLNNNFSSSLEETKCFVTDCENLIASDGSILISSNQINEKKLNEFPDNLIILSDTMKLKNTISEGLSEIKSKSKNIPTNITTIKNFNVIKGDKDFLSYGTSSKNLYLILLEKGFE